MSISQILALIRDAVIIGLVLWIAIFLYRSGENADIKADLQALQKQLAQNSSDQNRWEGERRDAETQRQTDVVALTAAIDAQRTPIRLCNKAGPSTLPLNPASPSSGAAGAGGLAEGSGEDLRSQVNAFERKYEAYLGQCRAILKSWPH